MLSNLLEKEAANWYDDQFGIKRVYFRFAIRLWEQIFADAQNLGKMCERNRQWILLFCKDANIIDINT